MDGTEMETLLDLISLPEVTNEQSKLSICESTSKRNVKNSKTSKAAGPDGFPSEGHTETKATYNQLLRTGYSSNNLSDTKRG